MKRNKLPEPLPKGTKINPWRLRYEKQRKGKIAPIIVRWITLPGSAKGTNDRLPPEKYERIRNDHEELEKLVRRLNAEQFKEEKAKEKVLDKHAFINEDLLAEYQEWLFLQVPLERNARVQLSYLRRYVINYFVHELNLPNPKDWYDVHDSKWAAFLLSNKAPAALATKKAIIQSANRFLGWLHRQRKNEVPPMVFRPLSKSKLTRLNREQIFEGRNKKRRRAISDTDWKTIRLALPSDIKPFIMLCYHYGLRRSEAMGFNSTDSVFEDSLELTQQLESFRDGKPSYGPLKTPGVKPSGYEGEPEKRIIPHWFCDPEETYNWISEGLKTLMHPDTLTHRWEDLMTKLEMDYEIHELRHTWITRARAIHSSREVQLAAGHKSVSTTEKYSHDHRNQARKKFKPNAA